MKIISVTDAQAGMILARPVEDRLGRTLLRKGEELTAEILDRLLSFGIHRVSITPPASVVEEIEPVLSQSLDEELTHRLQKVLDLRFQDHADNPRMDTIRQAVLASLTRWEQRG
jgi:hypothetical protein